MNYQTSQQNQSQQVNTINAFKQYFQTFSLYFFKIEELVDGRLISKFLSHVQNFPQHILIKQTKQIYGSQVTNLKTIVGCIISFQRENLRNGSYNLNYDYFQIYNNNVVQKYLKINLIYSILIQSLRTAIEGPNSQFFIRKVMSLSQKSQTIFLNLIKHFIKSLSSTPNTTPNTTPKVDKQKMNQSTPNKSSHKSFQKYYLQSDQRRILQIQINRLVTQNQNLIDSISQLQRQIENLRNQNSNLGNLINQLQEKIYFLTKEYTEQQQKLVQNLNAKISQISKQSIQMIQIHKVQKQNLKILYQKKIIQLNQCITKRQQALSQTQQQFQIVLQNIQSLSKKLTQKENNLNQFYQQKIKLLSSNNNFQQLNMKLLKQIQKKNSKIEQLQLVINIKNTQKQDQIMELKLNSPTRLELGQKIHFSLNNHSNQKKEQEFTKIQNLQINILKNKLQQFEKLVQYQNKQIKSLSKNKVKIDNLQGQNKKLMRLLKQYQQYRGQQNEILMGCIYQMNLKLKNSDKHEINKSIKNNSMANNTQYCSQNNTNKSLNSSMQQVLRSKDFQYNGNNVSLRINSNSYKLKQSSRSNNNLSLSIKDITQSQNYKNNY